jgi:hypothetical protein
MSILSSTDDEFVAAFEACALFEFHHEDHVRVAWIYLSRYSLPDAIGRFSASLRRFAASKGKPDLFHETITWAYLLLINECMHCDDAPRTWEEFAVKNPQFLESPKIFLGRYYSEALLNSARARRTFVFPDRITPLQSHAML